MSNNKRDYTILYFSEDPRISEMSLTGILDTDKYILSFLPDNDLLSICSTDKYANMLCDEQFWVEKFINKYYHRVYEYNDSYKFLYFKFNKLTKHELYMYCIIQGYISYIRFLIEEKNISLDFYDQPVDLSKIKNDIINYEDEMNSYTGLMFAVYYNDYDIVKLLLSYGANVNGIYAGWKFVDQTFNIVKINDMEHNYMYNDDFEFGPSRPLYIAIYNYYNLGIGMDIILLLLDYGANINDSDDEYFGSILEHAILYDTPDLNLVQLLLDVPYVDVVGRRHRIYKTAILTGDLDIVKMFYEKNKYITYKNNMLIKLAEEKGYNNIADFLKSKLSIDAI